jgi:diguanylate cyclase (GGDEF)-like protein
MPPGWDGIETIERLWKADPLLQTVICSAYSDYSWDDIHARLGDSDRLLILKKPFDNAEISQLAAALTEKYRLAQMARFRIEELDRVVTERTRELQRANDQLRLEVEQRRSIEDRLRHDVLHDRLTGLPNRAMLIDRIEQCIRRRKRDQNYLFALLFMDMDDFKVVNDSLGHEAGDRLLVGISQRLSGAVRSLDTTGRIGDEVTSRLGGDEFVILLDGLTSEADAVTVANRIASLMAAPFDLNGRDVVANLSIGVALGKAEYDRAADILRDADSAVYRAKNKGKHQVAVFDSEMLYEARERLELESDLRKAVTGDEFFLVYQPIIALSTGEIHGFEALVRWRHPTHGLTMPSRFIPIAETTGLIIPIGAQVIRQACQQIKAWREKFGDHPDYRDLWVGVNLSGKQLNFGGLVEQIDDIVDGLSLDHSLMRLEITEDAVIQHGDSGIKTLQKLRDRKFRLALDDFGTGYSSLSYLHRMPVDSIKIDQSFIRKLDAQGRPFSATVQAIVNLAHNCEMTVVGEGIENLEQIVQLQTLECDFAQGFWFSHPVAAAEAEKLLVQNRGTGLWRKRVQELAKSTQHSEPAKAASA